MSLIAILLLFLITMATVILAQIKRMMNKAERLGDDVHAIVQNVRGYSENLGTSIVGKIFTAIVKATRNRHSHDEDDE